MIDIYRYSKRDGEGAIQRESEEELKTLKERERGLYDAKTSTTISSESPLNKLLFVSLDAFFVLNKVLKCIILKKCNK